MGKVAIFEVLRKGPFRALWGAQIFSQLGINLLTFVLALRVYELTHKNTAVSLLTVSVVVPAMLLGVIAGVLVERYDKRKVIFWCNLLRAIAVFGFLLTKETLFFIYALMVVISSVTQFFVPAEGPLIPKIVPGKDLVTANSVFIMTIFVTMLAGGLLAGPLLDLFGIDVVFLVIAGFYLLATVFSLQLPSNGGHSGNVGLRIKEEFVEGIKFLKSNRPVLTALLLLVGSQTVIASVSTLLPGLADRVLHLPVNMASVWLLGPAIGGIIVGAVVVSQLRWPLTRNLKTGFLAVLTSFGLLGVSTNLIVSQILLFVLGIGNAFIDVSSNTMLQKNTDEKLRSRVFGVLTSLGGSFFILPVLLMGYFSDLVGVSGILIITAGLLFLVFMVKIRKLNDQFT